MYAEEKGRRFMTTEDFWKRLASCWIDIYRPEEKLQTDKSVDEYFAVADKVQSGIPNLLDAINDLMEEDDGNSI